MAIQFQNVTKSYAMGKHTVRALRGVDSVINGGEFTILVGPSGSGKSTLLNLAGCLDTADEGCVQIDGVDVAALTAAERAYLRNEKIGFVFQNFNLIPVLSVVENVELPLLIGKRKISSVEARDRALTMLEQVGLTEHAAHRPNELSGGQMQRVAIARALVTNPRVVLADEPTANLDSVTAGMVMEIMHQMNTTQKVTFLLATHDHRALKYASRVVRMEDGMLLDEAPLAS